MISPASQWIARSPFEGFLVAQVCIQANGAPLSVVSALARLDVDPWREAEGLAKMSRDAAAQRMRMLIAALPDVTPVHEDLSEIAARLVALLPPRQAASRRMRNQIAAATARMPLHNRAVVFLIVTTLLLEAQTVLLRNVLRPLEAGAIHRTDHSEGSSPSSATGRVGMRLGPNGYLWPDRVDEF